VSRAKKLCLWVKDSGLKRGYIAKEMNITRQGLSKKMEDPDRFKPSEIRTLKKCGMTQEQVNEIFLTEE